MGFLEDSIIILVSQVSGRLSGTMDRKEQIIFNEIRIIITLNLID